MIGTALEIFLTGCVSSRIKPGILETRNPMVAVLARFARRAPHAAIKPRAHFGERVRQNETNLGHTNTKAWG